MTSTSRNQYDSRDEKYRICIVAPPGYVHAACFTEVAYLLKSSFDTLGLEGDIVANSMDIARINIVLGCHLLQFEEQLKAYRYVPYQLEQLSLNEGAFNDNLRNVLAHAYQVWDYSQENIEFLSRFDIPAQLLPVGYHENLEVIPQSVDKTVDVLFYGSVQQRRKAILDRLAADPGIRLKHLFGAYSKERDAWIAQAKIVLNIHHYSARIFEAVRISYLLNNRCFVISEHSDVYPYAGVNLVRVSYDNLVAACREYAQQPGRMHEIAAGNYTEFKTNFAMPSLLQKVLSSSQPR
ncbi:MAG: hypothetical protein GF398_12920 [Chitinivibrionales bacterium]|nr:hypothetical protein [Chitinivibrionales bacterium]